MHAVIETTDSSFLHYWDKLCAGDPVQNPVYMQQRSNFHCQTQQESPFTDRSFLIMSAEEPVIGCNLTLHLDDQGRKCIGYFGRAASSHVNQASLQTPTNNFQPEAIRLLQEHISQLIEEIQPHSINYLDPVSCGVMSPITQVLLENGAVPIVQQAQVVDLSLSERELFRNLTKSCRGMVEWGRRNLEIEVISGDKFDGPLGGYATAIGKRSAPIENDETYEALIKKGNGFLVQGQCKGQLVSSSLFVHNNKTCHFVFADEIKNPRNRPVLHALIWRAMLQSKNADCNLFDFGSTSINHTNESVSTNRVFSASSFGGDSHPRLRVTLNR